MNTLDGSIFRYLSVELATESSTNVPVYYNAGAVYIDQSDPVDGRSYIYEAFTMNGKVELLRILNGPVPIIDWSYEFYDYSTTEYANDLIRRKDPKFITINPVDNSMFYLSGRYQG